MSVTTNSEIMARRTLDLNRSGDCKNCGKPAEAHTKVKVHRSANRWYYKYTCPEATGLLTGGGTR